MDAVQTLLMAGMVASGAVLVIGVFMIIRHVIMNKGTNPTAVLLRLIRPDRYVRRAERRHYRLSGGTNARKR